MRVSPEELPTVFVLAVSRDITRGEADEVLQKWRDIMLTTTCKFVLRNTPMDRYWAALEEREKMRAAYWAALRELRKKRPHRWEALLDPLGVKVQKGEAKST